MNDLEEFRKEVKRFAEEGFAELVRRYSAGERGFEISKCDLRRPRNEQGAFIADLYTLQMMFLRPATRLVKRQQPPLELVYLDADFLGVYETDQAQRFRLYHEGFMMYKYIVASPPPPPSS